MKSKKKRNISDTNLLLTITIVVFFAMYIGAMIFQGGGFLKTQTFFNILNANAALLITSCGLSLVMITGGIDISVGGVVALVSMSCGVYLDYMGGPLVWSQMSMKSSSDSCWPSMAIRSLIFSRCGDVYRPVRIP